METKPINVKRHLRELFEEAYAKTQADNSDHEFIRVEMGF